MMIDVVVIRGARSANYPALLGVVYVTERCKVAAILLPSLPC